MTRKELERYYLDRRKLREEEETLAGLKAYAIASGDDITCEITTLERLIQEKTADLSEREADVLATLDSIDDPCRRTEIKLHYYRGMSWDEISAILGRSLPSLRNRRNRALEQARIR